MVLWWLVGCGLQHRIEANSIGEIPTIRRKCDSEESRNIHLKASLYDEKWLDPCQIWYRAVIAST
ncbi:MAG: hypothetical protein AAF939_07750 [Planctomycetota bacterium]